MEAFGRRQDLTRSHPDQVFIPPGTASVDRANQILQRKVQGRDLASGRQVLFEIDPAFPRYAQVGDAVDLAIGMAAPPAIEGRLAAGERSMATRASPDGRLAGRDAREDRAQSLCGGRR
jgi:hypothetical protein